MSVESNSFAKNCSLYHGKIYVITVDHILT